jgi:hypothetical protein
VTVIVVLMAVVTWTGRAYADEPCAECGDGARGVPPGYRLVEGDILVRVRKGEDSKGDSTFLPNRPDYWPGGIVPYVFDANVLPAERTAMRAAMDEWEAVANVRFIPRTDQGDYVHIQDTSRQPDPRDRVNNSEIGRCGGKQIINISSWGSRFIMAHELAHTLGIWHEQSRPDRDRYIRINEDNIRSGREHNFDLHDDAGHYGPYDFDSVMHYGPNAFSANGQPTITVIRTSDVCPTLDACRDMMGQRNHLSRFDILTMSFLYPQPRWRFVDRASQRDEVTGSFLTPFKTMSAGVNGTPAGGTLWIQPGTYTAPERITKAMTLAAPLGRVTLGR